VDVECRNWRFYRRDLIDSGSVAVAEKAIAIIRLTANSPDTATLEDWPAERHIANVETWRVCETLNF